MGLEGSDTQANLRAAFARESQASSRYHWFAQQADVEGQPAAAVLFRAIAEREAGHAHGLLEYLAEVGDPATGATIGDTDDNLRSALAGEIEDHSETYPTFATTARDEGFVEIAEWFESMAEAEEQQAGKFRSALEGPDES